MASYNPPLFPEFLPESPSRGRQIRQLALLHEITLSDSTYMPWHLLDLQEMHAFMPQCICCTVWDWLCTEQVEGITPTVVQKGGGSCLPWLTLGM